MKIKWLAHSCFLIISEKGTRILIDPFDEQMGYVLPEVDADIVLSSHDHFDHNNIEIIGGSFKCFREAGDFTERDIKIKGVSTFHDEDGGSKRGTNIVFNLTIDGINVCHCGDLGHVLSDEQVKQVGNVDVLMIPVGGTYTIDAAAAAEVVKQLKPNTVIPMHYSPDGVDRKLDKIERFLYVVGGGKRVGSQEMEITKENMDVFKGVVVLDYSS